MAGSPMNRIWMGLVVATGACGLLNGCGGGSAEDPASTTATAEVGVAQALDTAPPALAEDMLRGATSATHAVDAALPDNVAAATGTIGDAPGETVGAMPEDRATAMALPKAASAAAWEQSDPATLATFVIDKRTNRGRALDLGTAQLTFNDDFNRPSVTTRHGAGPWFTGLHQGFGAARFLAADSGGPFAYGGGALRIRLEQRNGVWQSGMMQTGNPSGRGFAQKFGIFEMRAKFPKGNGTWPAFWLKTVNEFFDTTTSRGELDVIEAYGDNDHDGYHGNVHLWVSKTPRPGTLLTKSWHKSGYTTLNANMFDGQFHTYTAEVTPQWIYLYFDRAQVLQMPTPAEFRQPLFMLVDLALRSGVTGTPAVSDMVVDHVRAWQRPEWR